MPYEPITHADYETFREVFSSKADFKRRVKLEHHDGLGYVIHDTQDHAEYAWRVFTDGQFRSLCWITASTFKRRLKLGWPKGKEVPDDSITLDEMDAAIKVMEQMEGK